MKLRLFLFTLVCALVSGPAVRADDTELGEKMEKMGSAYRALRKQIADPSKNADSVSKVAVLREQAEASLKLEPAMKAEIPADQQAKFVADYRAEMKKFIEMTNKLEAALKANNNEEAGKLFNQIKDHQTQSHKLYKKEDKKKKT